MPQSWHLCVEVGGKLWVLILFFPLGVGGVNLRGQVFLATTSVSWKHLTDTTNLLRFTFLYFTGHPQEKLFIKL